MCKTRVRKHRYRVLLAKCEIQFPIAAMDQRTMTLHETDRDPLTTVTM